MHSGHARVEARNLATLGAQVPAASWHIDPQPSMVREVTAAGGVKFTPLVDLALEPEIASAMETGPETGPEAGAELAAGEPPPPKKLREVGAKAEVKEEMKAEAAARAAARVAAGAAATSSAVAVAAARVAAGAAATSSAVAVAAASLWWWRGRGVSRELGFAPQLRGCIFLTNSANQSECLRRQLFGLPHGQAGLLRQIDAARGSTLLFLFNFQRRCLLGAFIASGPAGFPLEASACPSTVTWGCSMAT